MTDFAEGEIDILFSTTIIESGLDFPNANTLDCGSGGAVWSVAACTSCAAGWGAGCAGPMPISSMHPGAR